MAEQLLKSVLITSLAGTALAVFITLLKPFTRRIFGSAWHYYIWLTVLIVMILPVRFTIMSNAGADIITADTQQAYTVPTAEISAEYQGEAAALPRSTVQTGAARLAGIAESGTDILCAVWFLGMILSFLITAVGYIRLIRKVFRNSVVISCPEIRRYTKRKITVRVCGGLSSPFIMGILRPSLILPDITLTPVQLDNILRHETTHLKRNDILYKWLAAVVKAIHWFNPAAYYAARQIAEECEISCDLSVTKNMNGEQKLSYVNTIISLLSPTVSSSIPLTTGMTGNKKMLRRRFIMIKNKKATSKIVSVLSAIIAVIMLGTTVFASGTLSGAASNDYVVKWSNHTGGNNKGVFANAAFVENGEVYMPLRELCYVVGAVTNNDDGSCINWDNGKIDLSVNVYNDNDDTFTVNYTLEIGKPYLGENENTTVMENAPVLREGITYIPYSYVDYMLNSKDCYAVNYSVYDKNDNLIASSSEPEAMVYISDEFGISLKIPAAWKDKYVTETEYYGEDSALLIFAQKATHEKYDGAGVLFRIEKVRTDYAEEILNMLGGSELLYSDDEYSYIFETPTDIQYPIWSDRDEEDIAIAEEYEEMFEYIDFILNSIEVSNTITTKATQ